MSDGGDSHGGRRATNLELFLDLVFVFGVSQVSVAFGESLSWPAFGRGVLSLWLLWWLWSQFAWLGTAIDLQGHTRSIVAILAAVAPTLVVAASIPEAYGRRGLAFAVGYLLVQAWSLAVQGQALWDDPTTRAAWLDYAPLAAIAPLLVLAGGLAGTGARPWLWIVAALVNATSAVLGSSARRGGTWTIDSSHFAERHALFVIIALGEVLVAIGVAASAVSLGGAALLGLLAAVLVAGALWWSYFGFVAVATERALDRTPPAGRVRLARDAFTFGHFPLVLGITLYAHVARLVVRRPTATLPLAERVALFGALACLLVGFVHLRWRLERVITTARLAALAVVAVVVFGGGLAAPAWAVAGGCGVVLLVLQVRVGGAVRPIATAAVQTPGTEPVARDSDGV